MGRSKFLPLRSRFPDQDAVALLGLGNSLALGSIVSTSHGSSQEMGSVMPPWTLDLCRTCPLHSPRDCSDMDLFASCSSPGCVVMTPVLEPKGSALFCLCQQKHVWAQAVAVYQLVHPEGAHGLLEMSACFKCLRKALGGGRQCGSLTRAPFL